MSVRKTKKDGNPRPKARVDAGFTLGEKALWRFIADALEKPKDRKRVFAQLLLEVELACQVATLCVKVKSPAAAIREIASTHKISVDTMKRYYRRHRRLAETLVSRLSPSVRGPSHRQEFMQNGTKSR